MNSDSGTHIAPHYGLRLTIWSCFAIGGLVDYIVGAIQNDWMACVIGLAFIFVSTVALGTGWWMRWPRG